MEKIFTSVIFDLDGVITRTALVHSQAWKEMFDEYLRFREKSYGEPFREFTHDNDYLPYVDGKPRYQGVASFLKKRNIDLPFGSPEDTTDMETVCGLGNRKDEKFNEVLVRDGIKVYISTLSFIKELLQNGIRIGVASSSKNCKKVLETVGIIDLFETRVDGIVSAELKLKGKPEPDIFTTACDNLGLTYNRTVIIEDAVSGVQAGRKGNFGLVVGVAREDNAIELKINGADIVVTDLSEINMNDIERWFSEGLEKDGWTLSYNDYVPKKEKVRETLCTIGNGYLGTRGALEESKANESNYPGTYIAGVYNRLVSHIAGKDIENEDLVNCPNWLPITFRIDDGNWIEFNDVEILSFHRELNFRNGLLSREVTLGDKDGRKSLIKSRRCASMANPHLMAVEYNLTPLNYSGKITIKSELDGTVVNDGVERYRQLNSKHLEPISQGGEDTLSYILLQTNESIIEIAEAAKLIISNGDEGLNPTIYQTHSPGLCVSTVTVDGNRGSTIRIQKLVSIFTSKDSNRSKSPLQESIALLDEVDSFDDIFDSSTKAWKNIWDKIDIQIEGDRLSQKLIRLNLYHTLITASPNNVNIDAGIPARGLSGEAYRGHIFWDELFILPIYHSHFPDVSRSVLQYRYRRLGQARDYAKAHGYKGAMFPWQSGSDGREETPKAHLNPQSGEWGPDFSAYQRHVSLAIAYNTYQYYHISEDFLFLKHFGAEILLEICRFWSSLATLNSKTNRYEIINVMGPNEYHETNPNGSTTALKDNSYTNILMVWTFNKALDIIDVLRDSGEDNVISKIGLTHEEIEHWKDICRNIHIPISDDGILEQYDGYFDLQELDWKKYKEKYGNISRLDRILKAEGKSPDDYKVNKQADALMIFYILSEDEIKSILIEAGYKLKPDFFLKNFNYYLKRTSHGSTLSRLVHSYLAGLLSKNKICWDLYQQALRSDYEGTPGSTTEEGIHAGVMAGTAFLAFRTFAGLDFEEDEIQVKVNLPASWRKLSFNFSHKKKLYSYEVTPENTQLRIS